MSEQQYALAQESQLPAKPPRTPEQREYTKIKRRESRARAKTKAEKKFQQPSCTDEPTKKDAREILAERGIQNEQVAATLYDLAKEAAQHHKIPLNYHLLRHGLQETLTALSSKKHQIVEVENAPVVGELITRKELHAIWDFSISWREDAVPFEEFLRIRKVCKTDAYELGLLLGKDFEQCQKNWAEFLPRFNTDTLPVNYTQKEMRLWLDSVAPVKDYLLLASRNSMKSSFSLVWLLTLHLCCPDARALLVSETQKLSAGFIRGYRSYWERKPNQDTVLTKFFPEYCITPGEGTARSFESPMAHLSLIQGSAESTSMESVVAGGRAEVLLFDDPISNLSCGTEEQRQKSVDNFDLLQKLREVLGSFSITIGTPWYADEDLYAVLLKRNEDDGGSLAFRIDPVVTLKPEAQNKLTPALLPTLTPDDVESYLLPVRMPWRFVKKEISANPTFALSQNFCLFPQDADADIKVQFAEADMRKRFRPIGTFSDATAQTVVSLDRAYSVSRYADFSAITVGKITPVDGKQALVVADVVLDRWRESELATNLVKVFEKYHPQVFVCEKDKGWEDLWAKVREAARLRNVVLPYFRWVAIDNTARASAKRAKRLELPLSDGRLWFATSHWMDEVVKQFTQYDGIKPSNSTRKDDAIAAISLLYEYYGPRTSGETAEGTSEERKQREQEAEAEAARLRQRHYYEQMFGNNAPPPSKPEEPPPATPADPRSRVFSYGRLVQPSADRNTPFGIRGRWRNRNG